MAEEIDDCEFYREDFSAQSEWEVFNAQICELFLKWDISNTNWGRELDPGELYRCKWKIEEEKLLFLSEEIKVVYFKVDIDCREVISSSITMSPMHQDLLLPRKLFGTAVTECQANDVPILAQIYNLRRFILVEMTNNNSNKKHLSDFGIILNSISVVSSEVCSSVPIFLQLYEPCWCYFIGVGTSFNMHTNFEVVTLNKSPKEYRYLSGLLKMFNEKVPHSYKQPAVVSVRHTYSLGNVKIRVPMYVPFGITSFSDEEESIISVSQFMALPHGYVPNSTTNTTVIFTWPEIAANIAIDSELQTQFTPVNAPCTFIYQTVYSTSYLSLCLSNFEKLSNVYKSVESYVGRDIHADYVAGVKAGYSSKHNSLEIRSHWQCKNSMDSVQFAPKKIPGPICEYELNQMLYYLFPERHPEDPLFPYDVEKTDPHRIKSAEPDSLVHRLSCLLATCNAHFGGESGMAQLWAAFVRELHILWNYYLIIPGVTSGYPDPKTCLLHQKLQMLNVCTKRRQHVWPNNVTNTDLTNDEEEFYDCLDVEGQCDGESFQTITATATATTNMKIAKPEGRLKRLGDAKLINGDDFIYIPITQEPPPKTEDQFLDDAGIILELGPGSDLMTQMMCSSLLSDMEAFKAANINAEMEDFIRWYSPNDWEEYKNESGEKGYKLSTRMLIPNNTWQNMWEKAKPNPACKQKRLFDDTKEGLKVLNYLEQRTLNEVYLLTIVPLVHSSILKLEDIFRNGDVLDIFEQYLNGILGDLNHFSRDIEMTYETPSKRQLPNVVPIVEKLEKLERDFYQYKCFQRIFDGVSEKMVKARFEEMLQNNSICTFDMRQNFNNVTQAEFLTKIRNLLIPNGSNDGLINKDYIIRVGNISNTVSQGDISTDLPQFLRATISGERLRLCGAFTENLTFLE